MGAAALASRPLPPWTAIPMQPFLLDCQVFCAKPGRGNRGEGRSQPGPNMTAFAVWTAHDYRASDVPGFALHRLPAPPLLEYASIQFGPLSTQQRRNLVGTLIANLVTSGWSTQLFFRQGATSAGPDDVPSFLHSIGGDLWWLGDIAIRVHDNDNSVLLSPEVDGEMLDVAAWGPSAADVLDDLVALAQGMANVEEDG